MPATCRRFGAQASNLPSTRSGLPPVPLAGFVVTGVLPRRTPRMPSPRMMFITRSRPTPAGSQPWATSCACIFPYPYTAMKKSERIWRTARASASRPARMRLTGRVLNMRQPRGVRNPQSNDSERTLQIGPTLKRLLCSSMYAAINAVPGRAWPRKKPTPSSKSRSPDAIARSRPAASSAPPSRPRPTASSPPRPSRPTGCANAAVIPALSPDPSPPRRSRSSPTNTRNAIPPAA